MPARIVLEGCKVAEFCNASLTPLELQLNRQALQIDCESDPEWTILRPQAIRLCVRYKLMSSKSINTSMKDWSFHGRVASKPGEIAHELNVLVLGGSPLLPAKQSAPDPLCRPKGILGSTF